MAGQEARLRALVAAQADATLGELREQLPTAPALSTLWTELDRLGLTFKKNGLLVDLSAAICIPKGKRIV